MGDAAPQEKDTLLIILPFPESNEILEGLRKKHPQFKIIYKTVNWRAKGKAVFQIKDDLDDGLYFPPSSLQLPLCQS
jgi:hypothetical protein